MVTDTFWGCLEALQHIYFFNHRLQSQIELDTQFYRCDFGQIHHFESVFISYENENTNEFTKML